MTEDEWLTAADPQAMLALLRGSGTASGRKLGLFASACVRRLWPLLVEGRSRKVVKVSERYADGVVGASKMSSVLGSASGACRSLLARGEPRQLAAAGIVRRLGFALGENVGEVVRASAEVAGPAAA